MSQRTEGQAKAVIMGINGEVKELPSYTEQPATYLLLPVSDVQV